MESDLSPSAPRRQAVRPSQVLWIALILCAAGILTRIPFRAQILNHWDSVNFALALTQFDVRLHQPHPPGTFVIYILLGRLFNVFLHDPNASLVWLSVLLSGLGVAALFGLTEAMFGRQVSLTTALLALTSPLVWFHGEVALSYILEFFWVPLVVYCCYRMQTRRAWAIYAAALLIGLAGGVRPNTPVFLFPLWLGAALLQRYSWKRFALSLVIMGVGVLCWAIPMVILSGGLRQYIDVMIWWQNQHTEGSASLMGIAENLARFVGYAAYSLGLGLIAVCAAAVGCAPGAVAGARRLAANWRSAIASLTAGDWRLFIVAGWVFPGAAYLTIIHLRQPGHIFTILPGMLVITALAIYWLARHRGAFRSRVWIGLTAGVVAVNAVFFVAAPTYLFGDTRMLFTTPSWNAIHDYDVFVTERLQTIRAQFAPEDTAILAGGRNFRLPDFYLADYQLPALSHLIDNGPVTLTAPVHRLVIFDEAQPAIVPPDVKMQAVSLPDGRPLYYVTWEANQSLEVDSEQLVLR